MTQMREKESGEAKMADTKVNDTAQSPAAATAPDDPGSTSD
jgi:hypothetical protein